MEAGDKVGTGAPTGRTKAKNKDECLTGRPGQVIGKSASPRLGFNRVDFFFWTQFCSILILAAYILMGWKCLGWWSALVVCTA